MSELTIFNTNGTQVYPENQATDTSANRVQPFINNVIEYYINTSENRIIALVQADAPQVAGRDRANFHVEFVGDDGDNLPSALVSELHNLAATGEWEFFKNEPRASTPWAVAEASTTNANYFEMPMVGLFSVRQLIENGVPLDFGLRSYQDSASTLFYFLNEVDSDIEYAIASNGRKSVIGQAELVLDPDCSQNFKIITESTEKRVVRRIEAIESDTRSFYRDEPIERIKALASSPELTPLQRLQQISALKKELADPSTSGKIDSSLEARYTDILERVRAIKETTAVGDSPSPALLDKETRESILREIRDSVSKQHTQLQKNIVEQSVTEVDTYIESIENQPIRKQLEQLQRIDRQLSVELTDGAMGADDKIVALIQNIRKAEILTTQQKTDIKDKVSSRITEHRRTLNSQEKQRIQNNIGNLSDELPPPGSSSGVQTGQEIEELLSDIQKSDQFTYQNTPQNQHLQPVDRIWEEISESTVLSSSDRHELQDCLVAELRSYLSKVKQSQKQKFKQHIDQELDQLRDNYPDPKEFQILNTIKRDVFLKERTEDRSLATIHSIIDKMENQELLSGSKKYLIKQHLHQRISDRKQQISQIEADRLRARLSRGLTESVENIEAAEGPQAAISALQDSKRYLYKQTEIQDLPDKLTSQYLNGLQTIRSEEQRDILSEEELEQIRQEVKADIDEQIKDLRVQRVDEIHQTFASQIEEVYDALANKPATLIRLLSGLRDWSDSDGNKRLGKSEYPEIDPALWQAVEKLKSLIEKPNNKDGVLRYTNRGDLSQRFDATLDSKIEEAQISLKEDYVIKMKGYIESTSSVDNNNIGKIADSIAELKSIKQAIREEDATVCDSQEPQRLLAEMQNSPLNDKQWSDFADQILTYIEEKIEMRSGIGYKEIQGEIDDKLAEIKSSDDSTEQRIRRIHQIGEFIRSDTVDPSDTHFDSEFIARCQSLPQDERAKSTEKLADAKLELSDTLANSIIYHLVEDLDSALESADSPGLALQTVKSYIKDDAEIGESSLLSDVKARYDRFSELHNDNFITDEIYEKWNDKLHKELITREQKYETPSSTDDGITDRLSGAVDSVTDLFSE